MCNTLEKSETNQKKVKNTKSKKNVIDEWITRSYVFISVSGLVFRKGARLIYMHSWFIVFEVGLEQDFT